MAADDLSPPSAGEPPEGSGEEPVGELSGLHGAVALLRRNPDFRKLFIAQIISYAGDWFLTVALFGLALEQPDNGELLTALVVVVQLMPFFFVSPLGGVLADRLDRRKLMVVADTARGVLCLVFVFFGAANAIWLAIVLQGLESAMAGLFDPASGAAVPNLVDAEDLPTANAVIGSAWGTMLAVGAALGGLVTVVFGRQAAFTIDAISFIVSAAIIASIKRPFSEPRAERAPHERSPGVFASIAEGLRFARTDKRVTALIAVKGGFGLAAGVGLVLVPILSERTFHAGSVGIGLLLGARGLGALTGPFLARGFSSTSQRRLFRAIGFALFGFGSAYLFLPLAPSMAVAAAIVFAAHLGGGAQWALSTYGLQTLTPDHIRGRIFAFDIALITLTLSISSVLAASIAQFAGPRVAIFVMALVSLAYATVWSLATRKLRAALPS